ncbi:MAG TPA: RDD family protein, partial [Aggregatilineales bacterium]|nr:RDD family protein [Aggregatilineales bacterium]
DGNPDQAVKQAISEASVLLVLIGHTWLATGWANDITHPLRVALSQAIFEKKPVLLISVDNAPMPTAQQVPLALATLTERIPIPLRTERFRADSQKIVNLLEDFLARDERGMPSFVLSMNRKGYQLAGGGQRFFANLLDGIILYGINSFLANVALSQMRNAVTLDELNNVLLVYYLITLALSLTYYIGLSKYGGQTFGKMALGIRVVRVNGDSLRWGNAILRYIGYILNAFSFGIGFLWILIDEKRQGWHDKMAGTIVIKTRP